MDHGWINGGFFVMNTKFLDFIKSDKTFLEREPLEIMTKKENNLLHINTVAFGNAWIH